MLKNRTKLTWRATDQDSYGEWTLAASAKGIKFTLYPGSFFTLVAHDANGKRLFSKTYNEAGSCKAAATRYVRQAVTA